MDLDFQTRLDFYQAIYPKPTTKGRALRWGLCVVESQIRKQSSTFVPCQQYEGPSRFLISFHTIWVKGQKINKRNIDSEAERQRRQWPRPEKARFWRISHVGALLGISSHIRSLDLGELLSFQSLFPHQGGSRGPAIWVRQRYPHLEEYDPCGLRDQIRVSSLGEKKKMWVPQRSDTFLPFQSELCFQI